MCPLDSPGWRCAAASRSSHPQSKQLCCKLAATACSASSGPAARATGRASRARPIRSTALASDNTLPRGPCVNTEQSGRAKSTTSRHVRPPCRRSFAAALVLVAALSLSVISLVYTPSRLTQRHAHLLHRMQSAPYMLLPGCRVHEPREGIAPSRGPAGHGWGRGAPARHRRGGRRTQASPAGAHTRLCRRCARPRPPRSQTWPALQPSVHKHGLSRPTQAHNPINTYSTRTHTHTHSHALRDPPGAPPGGKDNVSGRGPPPPTCRPLGCGRGGGDGCP